MANPVFDDWFSEQRLRRDEIGILASRFSENPSFRKDFYFSNSLSQKLEWMLHQDYNLEDFIVLVRAFEEWMAEQTILGNKAPESA